MAGTAAGEGGVSPPTLEEQRQAMSRLTGMTPGHAMDHDLALVGMIAEAQRRGLTWRQIASALHLGTPAEAKRYAKRLARGCQAKVLAEQFHAQNVA
jgi:hypothetical protein